MFYDTVENGSNDLLKYFKDLKELVLISCMAQTSLKSSNVKINKIDNQGGREADLAPKRIFWGSLFKKSHPFLPKK